MLHPKQWEILIEFLEKNPDIIAGRASGPNAKNIIKEKWQNIADILNSLGYGFRSADKWLKTWTDIKYNLKKKAGEIKKEQAKTGGGLGMTTTKVLTPFEERALQLLGSSFTGINEPEVGLTLSYSMFPRSIPQNVEPSPSTSKVVEEKGKETNAMERVRTSTAILTDDHPYSKKRRLKDSTEKDAYADTIEVLKEIKETLVTNLGEISNSIKGIAENTTKQYCQYCTHCLIE